MISENLRCTQTIQIVQLPRTIPKTVKNESKLPMLNLATLEVARKGDTWGDWLVARQELCTILFEAMGEMVHRRGNYKKVTERKTKYMT